MKRRTKTIRYTVHVEKLKPYHPRKQQPLFCESAPKPKQEDTARPPAIIKSQPTLASHTAPSYNPGNPRDVQPTTKPQPESPGLNSHTRSSEPKLHPQIMTHPFPKTGIKDPTEIEPSHSSLQDRQKDTTTSLATETFLHPESQDKTFIPKNIQSFPVKVSKYTSIAPMSTQPTESPRFPSIKKPRLPLLFLKTTPRQANSNQATRLPVSRELRAIQKKVRFQNPPVTTRQQSVQVSKQASKPSPDYHSQTTTVYREPTKYNLRPRKEVKYSK